MKTVNLTDIFDWWDSIPKMAADVHKSEWAVKKWKQRGSIPQDAWTTLIVAARRKGKKLTADDLLAMHSPRRAAELSAAACK